MRATSERLSLYLDHELRTAALVDLAGMIDTFLRCLVLHFGAKVALFQQRLLLEVAISVVEDADIDDRLLATGALRSRLGKGLD